MKLNDYNKNIKQFQGDCANISQENNEDEGQFSWNGCDIIHDDYRLGNTVYQVAGFNPLTKDIFRLGNICGQCLQYIINGDIPDFIQEG